MKVFTYRNRQRLKVGAVILAVLLVLACLGIVVSFAYLERYMVYTPEGARMVLPGEESEGLAAEANSETFSLVEVPDATVETLAPIQREVTPSEPQTVAQIDLTPEEEAQPEPLTGYYVTYDDLQDTARVLDLIQSDPDCGLVVLEVKSAYGSSYYSSALPGAVMSGSVNVEAVDALISILAAQDCRLVALVPAYSDSVFALDHQSEGLPISGGALWLDWDSHYWLDPASSVVQEHLVDLCTELTGLGFDEVAFSHFTIPDSENIVYSGDRNANLRDAGDLLVRTAQLLGMEVSFYDLSRTRPVVAPTTGGHLYFEAEDGATVNRILSWMGSDADALAGTLAFCTSSHDTRFADYSILRPLDFDE